MLNDDPSLAAATTEHDCVNCGGPDPDVACVYLSSVSLVSERAFADALPFLILDVVHRHVAHESGTGVRLSADR